MLLPFVPLPRLALRADGHFCLARHPHMAALAAAKLFQGNSLHGMIITYR